MATSISSKFKPGMYDISHVRPCENNIMEVYKYKISHNKVYGRFLEASRDIKQGEVILRDQPIIVGPSKSIEEPRCLSCYTILQARIYPCKLCNLAPLCSQQCHHHAGGHTKSECNLYAKLQHKITLIKLIQNFHVVTLIRCLLLRDDNKDNWDELMTMESHIEERRGTQIWQHHQHLVDILVDLMDDNEVNEELIQKLCGILDVNSFELGVMEKDAGFRINTICGVYTKAALMTHSCRGNTHLSVDGEHVMTVRASQDIQKGTIIYFNYANPLQGTIQRKKHLKEGKYFDCKCERCSDPTELGSHMSSFRCQVNSCAGLVVMQDPHFKEPFGKESIWKCNKCGIGKSGKDILIIVEKMAAELNNIDAGSEKQIESFLSTSSKYLSENHHIRVDAKQALAGLLRDSLNISINPTKKLMYKIVHLCREFLPLIDAIEPGLSRMRAITLYELHYPIVQIANRELESKDITKDQHLEKLLEAEGYLKEAVRLLLIEPPSTPEGILCKRAITELKELKSVVQKTVHK